jgi:phosphotransferase system enzyme I (PtsI)
MMIGKRERRLEKREECLRGLGVSDGIFIGCVLRLHTGPRHIYRATLDEKEVVREMRRLRAAVRLARRQLLSIRSRAEKKLGADQAYIFDAHLLLLEDRKLLDDIENLIRHERVNAEWAVKVAADRILAIYDEIKDDYLRERGSDIEDVMQRILVALSGGQTAYRQLTEDAVIVAEDLPPSTIAELDFEHACAIATGAGGWTSHTAIIARALGIPAVVALSEIYRRTRTGDEIIVDASRGEVIIHPTRATLDHYRLIAHKARAARQSFASENVRGPLYTSDGREIFLRANLELPAEYEGVSRYGARGVGLYRSEFLLSHRGAMPTEDEQVEAYVEVSKLAGEDGATIRLFDLGGDKMSGGLIEPERNPALGLRAIRFILSREEVLRMQARAILRAAAHGRLQIVLPMVSDITDVRRARRIIDEECARLEDEGRQIGNINLGAMIEVPAAVWVAEHLAREVDFFSLGTNDLVQYLLAVDRANDEVADWFRTLHPAVLQNISRTLAAAARAEISSIVCGEMAGTPLYAVLLIGLGATQLSMTTSSIPRVRHVLAQISSVDAKEIANECLECTTADDVEELVRLRFSAKWPHLFTPETLPPLRN